jgi:RNA polymerase sigma-70 factor (sigma-E family)
VDPYQGFNEYVVARTAALSRMAYLLTADHHLAEDLLQVALTRLASRWPEVRHGSPDAYVRRILVNELISWRRRRTFHERPADFQERPPELVVGDRADAIVRRLIVGRALAQLAPRQRAVLVLRYYEDLSEAETAALLGCAVGTVKSQTHHALARLRQLAPELAELLADATETEPNGVLT